MSPGVSAWVGFGAIPRFDDELRHWRPNELRLWQQVQLSKKYGPLQLVWRGRLEERFFEDSEGVAWRARSLLRGAWDLPGLDGRIALLLWDEPFVGLVGVNGEDFGAFDQNRAFVGGLLRLTPWAAVEVGYINVVLGDPFGPDCRMSHVAAACLALHVL